MSVYTAFASARTFEAVYDAAYVRKTSMLVVVMVVRSLGLGLVHAVDADLDMAARYAVFRDSLQLRADAGQAQGLEPFRYPAALRRDICQRGHKHIAGSAHAAVQVQRSHLRPSR